ncbi:MAG: response regulator [Thermoguttaceae bacterium]|nr:response regulator [Thermoguttaceae bacterium]
MTKKLLLVDDEKSVLESLQRVLRPARHDWETTCADRAEAAWDLLCRSEFDAVVTDVKMPGMSGLELLRRIRQSDDTRDLPVVVLTGLTDHDLKRRALELGASDLFNKPVDRGELTARLQNALEWKDRQDQMKAQLDRLREERRRQDAAFARRRLADVCRLAAAAEYRDETMGNHVVRVAYYSRAVAAELGLEEPFLEAILLAAPLHDIGKIGIPDAILRKPGPLTPGERAVMQRHCVIGHQILTDQSPVVAMLSADCPDLLHREAPYDPVVELAASIALTHHEGYNGQGYPLGLSGTQIPLASRIVALCDVFDALISPRPYKGPLPEEKALKVLEAESASHFDPAVHQAFVRALPAVRAIRERFDGPAADFWNMPGDDA